MDKDEEFKLVYGMLVSLRAFAKQLSSTEVQMLGDPHILRGYRTSAYKMNYFETSTSLKFVLNTDPDAVGVDDLLHDIYVTYVKTVVKNPLSCVDDDNVESELFYSKLDSIVKGHPCYT